MPSTPGEGKALRWGAGCCVVAESVNRPAAPSLRGEGLPAPLQGWGGEAAGSMVGGGAGPSQQESEI